MTTSLGQLLYRNARGNSVSTGDQSLDALLNLRAGTVLELCGAPGSGKSTISVLLAIDAARAGRRVRWICGKMRPFPLRRILQHPGYHDILLKYVEVIVANDPDELFMAGQSDTDNPIQLLIVDHWDEILPAMGLGTTKDVALKTKIKARQYIAKKLNLWSQTKFVVATSGMRPFKGVLMPSPMPIGNWHRVTLARNETAAPYAFSSSSKPVRLEYLLCQGGISQAQDSAGLSPGCGGVSRGMKTSVAQSSSCVEDSFGSDAWKCKSQGPASHSTQIGHNHSHNQHDNGAAEISLVLQPAASFTQDQQTAATDERPSPSIAASANGSAQCTAEPLGTSSGCQECVVPSRKCRHSPSVTPGSHTGMASSAEWKGARYACAQKRFTNPSPGIRGDWIAGCESEAGETTEPQNLNSENIVYADEVPNSQQELLDELPLRRPSSGSLERSMAGTESRNAG